MIVKNKIAKKYSDKELLKLIKEKDKHIIEILYEQFASKIYRKCIGMSNDEHMAKDLTHDIFIKIITKLNSFEGNSTFSLWVHSVTRNHCINHLIKHKKVIIEDITDEPFMEISIDEIEAEHEELVEIKVNQLKFLMAKLTILEREILILRYQEELSLKEIAISLNLGESAAKMRLKRTRDKLAQLFKEL